MGCIESCRWSGRCPKVPQLNKGSTSKFRPWRLFTGPSGAKSPSHSASAFRFLFLTSTPPLRNQLTGDTHLGYSKRKSSKPKVHPIAAPPARSLRMALSLHWPDHMAGREPRRWTLARDGLEHLGFPHFQTQGRPKSPSEIPKGGVAHAYNNIS